MAGEKTEKATPKRKKDEREKGNVFLSKDAITAISLLALFLSLKVLMPYIFTTCARLIQYFFEFDAQSVPMDARQMTRFFVKGAITFAIAAIPLLFISNVISIVMTMAQTKMLFSTKAFQFKGERLDPIKGIKKLFSMRSIVELLKAVIKITVLMAVMYDVYLDVLPVLPRMMDMSAIQSATYTAQNILKIAYRVGIAFVALAAGDYLYQWWEYEKNLRMSKQEIKDEYKQLEGDPQIKGHIRQIQQQRARQRMMQNVPDADMVIRNPTHVAVAISYKNEKHRAPIVVAKGLDELALRIVRVAEENGVYVTEDRPLARALYAAVDLDREIPEEYYQPIAKVLAFVYSLKKKEMKQDES